MKKQQYWEDWEFRLYIKKKKREKNECSFTAAAALVVGLIQR